MIFGTPETIYRAVADPCEPYTAWLLRGLTYRESQALEAEVGRRPVAAIDFFLSFYKAPAGEETEEERNARILRQTEEAAKLGEEKQALLAEAREYLERHNFYVCSYGVIGIDGVRKNRAEILELLDTMRPRSVVSALLSELASKIADLTNGEIKKKE